MEPQPPPPRPDWVIWSDPGAGVPPPPPPPPPPAAPPLRPRGAGVFVAAILAALTLGYVLAGYALPNRAGSMDRPMFDFGGRLEQVAPSEEPYGSSPGPVPGDVADIAARVIPSVVNITTTLGYQSGTAAGTGIVISTTGEVLTNYHVIDGATKISVDIGGSGSVHTATVLGRARTEDVALLQIEGVSTVKAARTAESTQVSVGDEVVAVGNALGRGGLPEVTSGTVTALEQQATAHDPAAGTSETLAGLIQTNVPLQPGDSGGPLIDSQARVVGINTAASGIGRSGSPGSIGLAIPIERALAIANQIRAGKASAAVQLGPRGFLGVQVARGRGTVAGAAVSNVGDGTPAEAAGMGRGDIITSVDGVTVDSPSSLTSLLEVHRPGESVSVGWLDASGAARSARIRLGAGG